MASMKPEPAVVSLTEEPKADSFDQKEENDFDEPATVPAKYRGTAHDKSEMIMMGKKQVLRVCVLAKLSRCPPPYLQRDYHLFLPLTCAAKFQVSHDAGLCKHRHGQLGDSSPVSTPATRSLWDGFHGD